MVFFAFDHDALGEAMKRNWDKICPPAMFTAAGNVSTASCEDNLALFDTAKWNQVVAKDVADTYKNPGYGFSGKGELTPNDNVPGSNDIPVLAKDGYFVDRFEKSTDNVVVPPGFELIRGENLQYVDNIPPFDITLTFANE